MALERVLIWGKTYPELSNKHRETVCTAGCLADGRPVRLYPVPLRYLPQMGQYSLYDWVEVDIERNTSDGRPESYKVRGVPRVVEKLNTDGNWEARRQILFNHPSWRYDCVSDLEAAQRHDKTSLGLVKVGRIERVWVKEKSATELRKHQQKMLLLRSQHSLFAEPSMRNLEPQAFKVHLKWRCHQPDGTTTCPGHTAGIMDWGLAELGRRDGKDAALTKAQFLADLERHDLHLLMGNFAAHPTKFGIIGLWYPLAPELLAARALAKRKPAPALPLFPGM